jgi:hypothetical protein
LAENAGVKFAILDFEAPVEVLRRRLIKRNSELRNVSEATDAVLERQLATAEPLGEDELRYVTAVRGPDSQDEIESLATLLMAPA